MPLAPNGNTTRLMAVVRARTPVRARHRLRSRLDGLLSIDVITTHYPDPGGQVLLNITFPPTTDALIRRAADTQGPRPHIFVQQTVRRALAHQACRDTESSTARCSSSSPAPTPLTSWRPSAAPSHQTSPPAWKYTFLRRGLRD